MIYPLSLADTCLVSSLERPYIAAMNISMCVFGEYMHSLLLGIYLGMESLGHRVTYVHFSRYCHTLFQIDCNS